MAEKFRSSADGQFLLCQAPANRAAHHSAEAMMGGGNAQKSAKARADKQAKMAKASVRARARGDDLNARSRTAAIFAPF